MELIVSFLQVIVYSHAWESVNQGISRIHHHYHFHNQNNCEIEIRFIQKNNNRSSRYVQNYLCQNKSNIKHKRHRNQQLHKNRFFVRHNTNTIKEPHDIKQPFHWPVKKEAVVEGDLILGGLMMVFIHLVIYFLLIIIICICLGTFKGRFGNMWSYNASRWNPGFGNYALHIG